MPVPAAVSVHLSKNETADHSVGSVSGMAGCGY